MTEEQVDSTEGLDAQDTGNDQDQNRDQAQRMFTQADLDHKVKERIERERKKFSDYADLKAAADELAALKQAQMSEAEKLQSQLATIQEENARLQTERTQTLVRLAIEAEARQARFARPELAYKLADLEGVQVDGDGTVKGADAVVKALSEQYPELLETQGRLNATNLPRGGEHGETDEARRARLFGYGSSSPIGTGAGGGVVWPKQP